MDFLAKETIVLALGSPLSLSVGVASGTIAFSFALAGFITKLVVIGPGMGGVDGSIATLDYH